MNGLPMSSHSPSSPEDSFQNAISSHLSSSSLHSWWKAQTPREASGLQAPAGFCISTPFLTAEALPSGCSAHTPSPGTCFLRVSLPLTPVSVSLYHTAFQWVAPHLILSSFGPHLGCEPHVGSEAVWARG